MLEDVQKRAEYNTKNAEARKAGLLPQIPDTETIKTPLAKQRLSQKEGRPDVMFVDVGAKFLVVEDEMKRLANAKRRQEFKAKKRAQ